MPNNDNELLLKDLEECVLRFPMDHSRRTTRHKEIALWIIEYVHTQYETPLTGVLRRDAEYIIQKFLWKHRQSKVHPAKSDLSFWSVIYSEET